MPRRNKSYTRSRARLDSYDYHVVPDPIYRKVRIAVNSMTDIRISDITTDINSSDGHIYLEGKNYIYLTSFMVQHDGQWYLEISMIEEDAS